MCFTLECLVRKLRTEKVFFSQRRQIYCPGVIASDLSWVMASPGAGVEAVDEGSTRVSRHHVLPTYRVNHTMALSERPSASLSNTSSSEVPVRLPKPASPVQSCIRSPISSIEWSQWLLDGFERSPGRSSSVDLPSTLSLLASTKYFSRASVTSRS